VESPVCPSRRALWIAIAAGLTAAAAPCRAGEAATDSAGRPPAYKQLRYDEDYRYLRDPDRRQDLFDPVKLIELDDAGEVYLTLGGEARERYEYFHNSLWGQGPQDDDGYFLQRYMLHADFHVGPHVRLFSQLKSALEDGREGGPRPTDEDQLDLHQGFLELAAPVDPSVDVMVRIGRQELAFGSSRLVSVREGPNVRQSFDGARLGARVLDWRVDGFVTRPVETDPGIFDDASDKDRAFWGAYVSGPMPFLGVNLDVYYLGLSRRDARFDQGTADEHRHAVGTRVWGKPKPLDYNVEAVYEFGTFGDGRIDAWTAASDVGFTAEDLPTGPRAGLKANITSGDGDPSTQGLQTFNAYFPRGAYFSEAALIGPANHMDLHPSLTLHPVEAVKVSVEWDFFWRQSLDDGLYGVALNLVRSGRSSRERYIGSEAIANLEWEVQRHVTIAAAYSHFFAGPFLRDTGPAKDVDYATLWVTFKF